MKELIILLISLLLAGTSAFFGYKFHKILISLCGFILAFLITGTIVAELIDTLYLVYLIAAVGGILGGFVAMRIEKAGIFLLCGIGIFLASYVYIDQIILKWTIGILGGIVGGILGVKFSKWAIIIATGFQGSLLFVNLLIDYFKLTDTTIPFICSILLAIIAIYYQFLTNKHVSK